MLNDHSRGNCLASIEAKGRRELDFVFPHGIPVSPASPLYRVDREASPVILLEATHETRLLKFFLHPPIRFLSNS